MTSVHAPLDNIAAIQRYAAGMSFSEFELDRKTRDAVERCLERISEAAAKLGDLAPTLMPEQPWPKIRGLGNQLRHEYDRIDVVRLWLLIEGDLPPLKTAAQAALEGLQESEEHP